MKCLRHWREAADAAPQRGQGLGRHCQATSPGKGLSRAAELSLREHRLGTSAALPVLPQDRETPGTTVPRDHADEEAE